MITITIDQPLVEEAVRSLALSHNLTESDIIVGAVAQQLGFQSLVYEKFTAPYAPYYEANTEL